MTDWRLTDNEWKELGSLLEGPSFASERRGRHRSGEAKTVVEACLFRHFHSLAPQRPCFGWNELPIECGCSPATVNRRFNGWLESGTWVRFWDALLDLRFGAHRGADWAVPGTATPPSPLDSPVRAILADLERAFFFFNARFFGGTLPGNIIVSLEDRAPAGYFCAKRWLAARGRVTHHLMISFAAIGEGKAAALGVLLHEMVHYRNHCVGVADCSLGQYHNRHFRDTALLAGLLCEERDHWYGYAVTCIGPRGQRAVADFQVADDQTFNTLRAQPLSSPRQGKKC